MNTTIIRHQHQDLVEQSGQGNSQAQRQLFHLYNKAMLNTAYRMLNSREDAEDVVQESFLKAFDQLGNFRNESSFGTWLKRIVINRSINLLKSRKTHFALDGMEDYLNIPGPEKEEPKVFPYSVQQARQAMQKLPDGYRTIFSLYLLEGYDHQEIAEILGISISTSLSQFHRAKKRLLKILESRK